MKKILISVLITLLIILTYFTLSKGINLLNIKSIRGIKAKSDELESEFNEANELSNKTYPEEVQGLEEAIKKLKISKQEYENKNVPNKEKLSVGTVEIKTYKIHYLWTILGNYRKNRGVQSLNLDLKSTQTQDVYDLEFTLIGSYTSITDFLYDIENDEELNFEIKNFNISSQINNIQGQNENTQNNSNNDNQNNENNTNNENNAEDENNTNNSDNTAKSEQQNNATTQKSDGVTLQASFKVENIGITLD